jgi:hypothetical protein
VDDAAHERQPVAASARTETTVEAEVRARVAEGIGGPRGAVEVVLPFVVFTTAFLLTDEVRPAVALGIGSGVLLLVARLAQRSTTRFVRNGLIGIAVAAVVATATGRAEAAFLPGIVQNAAWAVALTVSILVRWPAAGFLIGAILGDVTDWRRDPAILRLGNRLTLVLLVPMVLRVAVQYPLYVAEAVGWLGVTRVVLGWPLSLAAFAVGGTILARGQTPIRRPALPGHET